MNFKNEHTFFWNWNKVTLSYLKKYPNPQCNHIKEVDYIDVKLDSNEDTLYIKRLLTFEFEIPMFCKNLIHNYNIVSNKSYILEDIIIDNKNKTMKTDSRNLFKNDILTIIEKSSYEMIQDYTKYKQNILINSQYSFLSKFCHNYLGKRSYIGIKVLENILKGT
jgi:hypothetical protein